MNSRDARMGTLAMAAAVSFWGCAAPTSEEPTDAGSTDDSPLRAQDITVLYPYPTTSDLELLLDATAAGPQGELIPADVFAMLPQVVRHPTPRTNNRSDTYMIGFRANCANDTMLDDDPCRGQLQLVFQVFAPGPGGSAEVFDASIHAVYPLDDATFGALLDDLLAVKRTYGGYDAQSLGVHPILARQGMSGGFATALATIVKRYAGASTLHKVTFITIEQPTPTAQGGEVWKFGAVENKSGVFTPLEIPSFGTATTEQTLTSIGQSASFAASDFSVAATPDLPTTSDLRGLFGRGSIVDTASAENAYDVALRLENPTLRSAADADCITCHITHARKRGELLLGLEPTNQSSFYAAGTALGGATVTSAVGVRALGWSVFAPKPSDAAANERATRSVSQRVINETIYTLGLASTLMSTQ